MSYLEVKSEARIIDIGRQYLRLLDVYYQDGCPCLYWGPIDTKHQTRFCEVQVVAANHMPVDNVDIGTNT
jgi:hypothetical protein